MSYDDLDPVSKQKLGKIFQWIGIAAISVGVIGGILVALAPTEGTDMTTRQNILFGISCCFGPSLLAAIPALIVGGMMRRAARDDDSGSLYRGWD